jgi:hypothetical protein
VGEVFGGFCTKNLLHIPRQAEVKNRDFVSETFNSQVEVSTIHQGEQLFSFDAAAPATALLFHRLQ